MKIILLKEIKNIGKKGEIITVKNGYAKNYLFPKQIALLATKNNVEDIKKSESLFNNDNYKEINKLNNVSLMIPVTLKDKENIYGSINSKVLHKLLKKLNLQLNIRHLETDILMKKLGKYKLEFHNKKYNLKTILHVLLIEKKNK